MDTCQIGAGACSSYLQSYSPYLLCHPWQNLGSDSRSNSSKTLSSMQKGRNIDGVLYMGTKNIPSLLHAVLDRVTPNETQRKEDFELSSVP